MATPRLKDKVPEGKLSCAESRNFSTAQLCRFRSIEKICINKGMGVAVTDKKLVDVALDEVTQITGQKAVSTKSKKAISNFKLRENMPIGVRVTLARRPYVRIP